MEGEGIGVLGVEVGGWEGGGESSSNPVQRTQQTLTLNYTLIIQCIVKRTHTQKRHNACKVVTANVTRQA